MRVLWAGMIVAAGVAWGQKAALPPPPAGIVAGHVTCGDTLRPARFAQVQLMLKPEPGELEALQAANKAGVPLTRQAQRTIMTEAHTGLDGSFRATGVAPGDYYVIAVLAGYVFPAAPQENEADAADLAKVLAGVPLVHVSADKTVETAVTLQKGATVSGRMTYDDGQPVVRGYVNVRPVEGIDDLYRTSYGPLQNLSANQQRELTDDDGHYRLAGLRPGKYRITVTVQVSGGNRAISMPNGSTMFTSTGASTSLYFYAPGVMHEKDARIVDIKGSEAFNDVNLEIGLTAMHSVEGRLLAKEDSRPVNKARVQLKDDNDTNFSRSTQVLPDGSWKMEFLPAGTYTLSVTGASEVVDPEANPYIGGKVETLRTFAKAQVGVIVLDHDVKVDDLALDEVKGKK